MPTGMRSCRSGGRRWHFKANSLGCIWEGKNLDDATNAAFGAHSRTGVVGRERVGTRPGHAVRGLDEEPDEAGLPDVVLLWDGRPVLRTGVEPEPREQCRVRGERDWDRRRAGLFGRNPAGEGPLEQL